MPQTPAYHYLDSSDPLSEDAISFLLNYTEEDILVDYKVDFDRSDEKHWLDITIDVMAFANTHGGYIVFVIKDRTYEKVGISEELSDALTDINNILQKLNRYIGPKFTEIRSKKTRCGNRVFVIWHVPESKGTTHVGIKKAAFKYPSGQEKIIIWPGVVYLRISGKNQMLDPDGIDFLLKKRMKYFREELLERIAKVVKAPSESKVLIVANDPASSDVQKVTISEVPDAIPIKGMSFSIPPGTNEETITSWIALFKSDPNFRPPVKTLWCIYADRKSLKLSEDQLASMAFFCLISNVPHFFWLKNLKGDKVKKMILEALRMDLNINAKAAFLHTGAFLGKSFYHSLLKKVGSDIRKLAPRSKRFPISGPREFFCPQYVDVLRNSREKLSESDFRSPLEDKLTEMAKQMIGKSEIMRIWEMQSYDCYLYARDDQYK